MVYAENRVFVDCKKTKSVAFCSISPMQVALIPGRSTRRDRSTGHAGSRLRDKLDPQGSGMVQLTHLRGCKSGVAGVELAPVSGPPGASLGSGVVAPRASTPATRRSTACWPGPRTPSLREGPGSASVRSGSPDPVAGTGAPARPCGRGKLAQFSFLQRFAVWWVAPPWPILSVAAALLALCRLVETKRTYGR